MKAPDPPCGEGSQPERKVNTASPGGAAPDRGKASFVPTSPLLASGFTLGRKFPTVRLSEWQAEEATGRRAQVEDGIYHQRAGPGLETWVMMKAGAWEPWHKDSASQEEQLRGSVRTTCARTWMGP